MPHTCYFFPTVLLSNFWTSVVTVVVPSSPRYLPLKFLSRVGFGNPTARRFFIDCCYNLRSRASRKSICAQEKVPTNVYGYALGGVRTHGTDLYQARGQPDTPPGRTAATLIQPTALFVLGCECSPCAVLHSRQTILTALYRDNALLGDPHFM